MRKQLKSILKADYNTLKTPTILLVIDALFQMIPYMIMYFTIIDLFNSSITKSKLINYTLIILFATILRIIIGGKGYSQIQIRGARAVEHLRISLAEHLRQLHLGYFNKKNIGYLSSIMTNDMASLEKIITHRVSDLIKLVVIIIYIIVLLFTVNLKLALIELAFVIIGLPLVYFSGVIVEKTGYKQKKILNTVVSGMLEFFNGIEVFKAYSMVGKNFKRLEESFKHLYKRSIQLELCVAPFVMTFNFLIDISYPIVLLFATKALIANEITKITFFSFTLMLLALVNTLRQFAVIYPETQYLKIAQKKLLSIENEKAQPFVKDKENKNNTIEFKNVSFEYEEKTPVIKNLSFVAKEGTTTALIGPSGCGKTTIMNLIARFYDINNGQILLGDTEIREIEPELLLSKLSMVFQEVYLLCDTVYNNILMGNPKATKEQVIHAAKLASVHEDILNLENGYDTFVGEGGTKLSGGERQRISLARALIKDAPIILLDEATASIDMDNEIQIRKALDIITKNKTVIIIAHRLNTIKNADNILVLNNGVIEEMGNHKNLISKKGTYFRMINDIENSLKFKL